MTTLRQSAKGQHCTLRLLGCQPGPENETVVLAHINHPMRAGMRTSDHYAVFACCHCHDIIDGRTDSSMMPKEVLHAQLRALYETWEVWIDMGLIQVEKQPGHGTG